MHYHGKPATCKVLEHFVRTTPVVEKCDDPRCFSRLVIVPKREPGSTKDSPPTSYRVTMDALINHCLKPVANTLPLATDEIKKLHAYKFFLKSLRNSWRFKRNKAYSPGVGSQWAAAQPVRSNRLHSIQLWINICLQNGDTE